MEEAICGWHVYSVHHLHVLNFLLCKINIVEVN